jgi:hypothetical protein
VRFGLVASGHGSGMRHACNRYAGASWH